MLVAVALAYKDRAAVCPALAAVASACKVKAACPALVEVVVALR